MKKIQKTEKLVIYYSQLDCDTLDMVDSLIVNMVQFYLCLLDINIHPLLVYILVRIVEISVQKVDVLCK